MTLMIPAPGIGVTLEKADFRRINARGGAAIHIARYGASWDDEPAKFTAIKKAFTMLERINAFNRIDTMGFLALDENGSLLNWFQAGPAAVNNGMAFGPLGFTGDGSSAYIDTGFNPATAPSPRYQVTTAHIGVYISDNAGPVGASNVALGTGAAATLRTALYPKNIAGMSAFRINGASTNSFTNPRSGQNGFLLAQRVGANTTRLLHNREVIFTSSSDPVAESNPLPNGNFAIGRHNANYGSGTYAGWSIGQSMAVSTGMEEVFVEAMMMLGEAMTAA